MSPIATGRRNKLVQLEQGTDEDGIIGDPWAALSPATAWAAIEPVVGAISDTTGAESALITIPYHAGVTTRTRILHNNRAYYVRGVSNPDEANIDTVCTCEVVENIGAAPPGDFSWVQEGWI